MPALRGQEFYHPHALYLQHMHAVQNSTALMCPISPEKAAISQENKDIHVLTHTKKIPYCSLISSKPRFACLGMIWKKLCLTTPPPAISSFKTQHDITKQKDICRLVKSYFYCPENQNINYLKIGLPFFPTDPFLLCKFLPNIAACQNLCRQSIWN